MNTTRDPKKPYLPPTAARSIPGFPSLRATVNGSIYRKRDGQRLQPRMVNGTLCVDVSEPKQRLSPWVPVAILVARAHVPIPRPLYRHRELVHLDGDRKNCKASNLAWVREPSRHNIERKRSRN